MSVSRSSRGLLSSSSTFGDARNTPFQIAGQRRVEAVEQTVSTGYRQLDPALRLPAECRDDVLEGSLGLQREPQRFALGIAHEPVDHVLQLLALVGRPLSHVSFKWLPPSVALGGVGRVRSRKLSRISRNDKVICALPSRRNLSGFGAGVDKWHRLSVSSRLDRARG